jgi:hypothetical protein
LEVTLSPEVLDAYVGEYENKSGLHFTVSKENGRLWLRSTAEPPLELYPDSETKFFTILDTTITFDKPEKGKAKSLTIRQSGKDTMAEKKP